MGRTIHHGRIGPEDILRAVAVMDVKVDDGGALDAVFPLRVTGRNGGVIKKAKSHGPVDFGMMARRADGDKSIPMAA